MFRHFFRELLFLALEDFRVMRRNDGSNLDDVAPISSIGVTSNAKASCYETTAYPGREDVGKVELAGQSDR
jgi:hypothetical protein